MTNIETENLTEYILVEYRWVVVMAFLLPLSFLWKVWSCVRNYVVFTLSSAPKMHHKKVKDVQNQVKEWIKAGRTTKLCTARPTWQTMSFRHGVYKKTFTNIKVNLVDVLEIDTKNMTVRCEPLVTMGQLSRTLEPLGLALAVVPELDQLTVGGLVMGTGIETSSHVHGLFQHICTQYELVLADGSVVTCSKDENPDLFYAVPWSYGTLGFLTSAVIKVVPAKKFVRLEYHPYSNLRDLAARFSEESLKKAPHQFVEALLYTKDTGVVMVGDMVDEVGSDGRLNQIGKWYARWFFTQVRDHMEAGRATGRALVEYIPLRDYYHRHTRSLFWELQDIISFGNNFIFRLLFGWLMPPEVSLLKLTQPEAVTKLYERAHVIQDMLVPMDRLEAAVELFHEEFQVYPIWLCPFKLFNQPGQLKVTAGDWQMFVDIGVYGVPKAKGFKTESSTRRVEDFVSKNDGFQMLYADTYTTKEEFRRMFDHTLYDKVRESLTYCKEAFPEIYGKVNRDVRK
ncbi:delta(24)-sterol reductase-like [Pectinophora gossypiella]|uniref:delta(24)-sterol reductase-like n=1 Tax=Pectinophora gossypiella TaxID=13191 RepID=UPI00214E9EC5|nr:delta(24)-sterol reductase-like [Pectinophora gossypiella]XP_049881862.1 delta(24)-sterol reductase-like [Pectinophora gossypiella]